MTRIKICGITNFEDAEAAVNAGAHALGFVFYTKSPRYINPEMAAGIIENLGPFVTTVGVFVNETPEAVRDIVLRTGLDAVQLHDFDQSSDFNEIPGKIILSFRVGENFDLRVLDKYYGNAFLLDTYVPGIAGGTGKTFDWEIASQAAKKHTIILAGGLTPQNVEEAILKVNPYAVDVSSGVEAEPGIKDHDLISSFIEKVYNAGSKQ